MFKVGTKVVIENVECEGTVVGHGFFESEHYVTLHPAYIVRLDKGLWTEDRKAFINLIVVHPDNAMEVNSDE